MNTIFSFLKEFFTIAIIVILIVVPLRLFVFQPFLVRGNSMEPNFHDGDYLIVDQLSYWFSDPARGEVIVFEYPYDPSQRYIKRIVGLPGEEIEVGDGKVIVYNQEEGANAVVLEEGYLPNGTNTNGAVRISLEDNQYFVLGDNRNASSDSRRWGSLPEDHIIGKVLFRVFSLPSASIVNTVIHPRF